MDLPTLYHETDARLVEMSSGEREQFMMACRNVINHLWPHIIPLLECKQRETIINGQKDFITAEKIEDYKDIINEKTNNVFGYYNVKDAISCIQSMKNGSCKFQYGNLYLISIKEKAFNYARMAAAEQPSDMSMQAVHGLGVKSMMVSGNHVVSISKLTP